MKTNTLFVEKWIGDLKKIETETKTDSAKNISISKTKPKNQISKLENLPSIIQNLIEAGSQGNLCIETDPDMQKEIQNLPPGSLIQENNLLYFPKTWQAKNDLEKGFRGLIAYTKSYREKFANRYTDEQIDQIITEIEKRWNDRASAKAKEKGNDNPKFAFQLNAKQKQAIRESVRSPFHIITGGPGTGKTTVVAFLMEVLHALGELPGTEDIALAAPTGRAGQRLTESIQFSWENMGSTIPNHKDTKGTTIHRLLRFQPRSQQFYYNKDRSFLHRLVLVDEVSMVDIFIFRSLIQALPVLEADREVLPFRLLLLGDPNQLPSVEKGAVFRDILQEIETRWKDNPELGSILLTKLEESNRHNSDEGKEILILANSILNDTTSTGHQGSKPKFWRDFEKEISDKEPSLSTIQRDFRIRDKTCDYLWTEVFQPQIKTITDWNLTINQDTGRTGILPSAENFSKWTTENKCLTLYRRGVFGIEGLQTLIENKAKRFLNTGNNKKIPRVLLGNRLYYPGLPIIISKNDSIRKLFNGDIGFVLLHDGELRACFLIDGLVRVFALDTLPDHEEAYFLTVHKSQGSEYENLFFYIPPARGQDMTDGIEDNGLANKQILYTGITRAKKRLEIFGSLAGWEEAISREQIRLTGFQLF